MYCISQVCTVFISIFRASEKPAAFLGGLEGPKQGADSGGGMWTSSQGLDML